MVAMVKKMYGFHNNVTSICHTSHLMLALVGLLQVMKGFGGVSGVEAAVITSRVSEFALFYELLKYTIIQIH